MEGKLREGEGWLGGGGEGTWKHPPQKPLRSLGEKISTSHFNNFKIQPKQMQ